MRGVLDLIEENNHDIQRTSSVSRSVLANFRCYHEMLQEKQQKTVQMTITSFFKRKGKEEELELQEEGQPKEGRVVSIEVRKSGNNGTSKHILFDLHNLTRNQFLA